MVVPIHFQCICSCFEIFSLIFLHLTSAFVSNFVEQTDRNRYFSIITTSQEPDSFLLEDSLTSTLYGIEALALLDKELPNASRVCASLNKRKPKKDDIYQVKNSAAVSGWNVVSQTRKRIERPSLLNRNFGLSNFEIEVWVIVKSSFTRTMHQHSPVELSLFSNDCFFFSSQIKSVLFEIL